MKQINLGLQGGGAHGAFTWGVLDRLLDESGLEIAAISGTSAGALNGAAFKAGWLAGGTEGARENLNWLWTRMGALENDELARWLSAMVPDSAMLSKWLEWAPPFIAADMASRVTTPYALGPVWRNPLRQVVEEFHYDKVCDLSGPKLFVGATNVRTGKIKVFTGDEISTNALLASACLPTLFQAVEIGDQAYWDGGYTGNPALFPLYDMDLPNDIVVVNINPLLRADVPKSPQQIQNRINEISFNAALMGEVRAIAFVKRLLAQGAVAPGAMKDVYLHMIADDDLMNDLSASTKLLPNPVLLERLKQAGRRAADRFLEAHWDDLNERGSVDLEHLVS